MLRKRERKGERERERERGGAVRQDGVRRERKRRREVGPHLIKWRHKGKQKADRRRDRQRQEFGVDKQKPTENKGQKQIERTERKGVNVCP